MIIVYIEIHTYIVVVLLASQSDSEMLRQNTLKIDMMRFAHVGLMS